MIRLRRWFLLALPLLIVPLVAGCGRDDADAAVELPDWLSETGDVASQGPQDSSPTAAPRAVAAPIVATSGTSVPQLRLKTGDRFPLRKVVEQELKQSSLDGRPQISRSRLELSMALSVAELRDTRTLMQVMYDRICYSHEVAGDVVEYDSTNPPQQVPASLLAYHGMVGDGFSFWIGADNRIAEVVGFREFVERCLSHIPPEQKEQAMIDVDASAGEKAIADFIDNTIGLMPHDVENVTGGSWERTQHIARPVPMQIHTVYTLSGFNEQTADVMIGGTISPSTTLGSASHDESQVRITIKGGRTSGRCTLFRDSGMPKESHVERIVDMSVQMAGGVGFDQQKRTTTTVECYPLQTQVSQQAGRRFQ